MRVTGSKRLSAKMLGLAEDLRQNVLLTAAQVGAIAVEGDAKHRVPRDTGALAGSIRREVIKDEANIAIVAVKAGGPGVHKGRPVARFVEFGTRKRPAQPFLRPALRENRSLIRRTVAGVVGASLRKFGL